MSGCLSNRETFFVPRVYRLEVPVCHVSMSRSLSSLPTPRLCQWALPTTRNTCTSIYMQHWDDSTYDLYLLNHTSQDLNVLHVHIYIIFVVSVTGCHVVSCTCTITKYHFFPQIWKPTMRSFNSPLNSLPSSPPHPHNSTSHTHHTLTHCLTYAFYIHVPNNLYVWCVLYAVSIIICVVCYNNVNLKQSRHTRAMSCISTTVKTLVNIHIVRIIHDDIIHDDIILMIWIKDR